MNKIDFLTKIKEIENEAIEKKEELMRMFVNKNAKHIRGEFISDNVGKIRIRSIYPVINGSDVEIYYNGVIYQPSGIRNERGTERVIKESEIKKR